MEKNDAQVQLQIFPVSPAHFSGQQRVHIIHQCTAYTEDYGMSFLNEIQIIKYKSKYTILNKVDLCLTQ